MAVDKTAAAASNSLNPFDFEEDEVEEGTKNSLAVKGSRHEPVPKYGHSTVAVDEKLYLWAGWQKGFPEVHSTTEKVDIISAMDVFDLQRGEWKHVDTYGKPPLGVRGYSCTAVGTCIYYFGGYCGHDWCRHCSLHCIDTTTLQWKEVPVSNPYQSPMKKNACGMISFHEESNDFLFVFGGAGMLCSANQPEAIYIPWKENPDFGWTNEAHIFSMKTGQWVTPSVEGERPPPCAGFTLTKITHNSALLYGGIDATTGNCLQDTYIVEMNMESIHWHKVPLVQDQPKPNNRHDHASVCISGPLYGQIKPMVLISGGRDSKWQSLGDLWLLDCSTGSWKQIEVPQSVAHRHFHSLSAFAVSSYCRYAVIFGGVKEWVRSEPASGQPMIADTTVLEICQKDEDDDWGVTAVLDSHMLTETEEYKGRLIQSLFEILKSKSQPQSSEFQQELIGLLSELECKQSRLREAEERANALDMELQDVRRQQHSSHTTTPQVTLPPQIDTSSPPPINMEQIAIEMTRDILEPYLIQREEITLTGPDIDVGVYGRTTLAQYKGSLQVTAKILTLSQSTAYSKVVLNHKLVQSFQVRHPNIVQLLFASTERDIVIVTETTPLILRHHLEKKAFNKQDIVSVSLDVAMALSYLHCHQPYPIVHRAVCSTSIVLEPSALKFRAKLIDFFTSNFFYYTTSSTETQFIVDPVYVPPPTPTRGDSSHSSDPTFDIFSFGIVIMEMVIRKLPPLDSTERERNLTAIKWPSLVNIIRKTTALQSADRPSAYEVFYTLQKL